MAVDAEQRRSYGLGREVEVVDPLAGPPLRWTSGPIVDVLAPAFVWLYVILGFEPLINLLVLPGFVSSVLLPSFGVGVLLLTPRDRIERIPVSLPLATLVAWLSATYLWSAFPTMTFFQIRSELAPLVVLSLVIGTMSPQRLLRTLRDAFVTFVVVSLVWAVALPAGRMTMMGAEEQFGFRGGFGHKNQLGVFAVCALAIVLPFARRHRTQLLVLCVAAVVGTRSATAASGLLTVVFFWTFVAVLQRQRSPRERQFLIIVGVSSGIAALLLVIGLLPVLLDLYDKDATFSGRTEIWAASIDAIAEQPLQGYGLGAVWSNGLAPITRQLHTDIGFPAAHSHNSVIEALLEGGVVGLSLLVLFVVQTLRLAGRAMSSPATAPYGQWGVLTVCALIVMGIAEPLIRGPNLGLIAITWTALALVDNQRRRRSAGRLPTATDTQRGVRSRA